MAEPATMLVRIAPTNNRESHYAFGVTVKKADGWCEIAASLARKLEKERMNPLNPSASQPVFEVASKAAAKAQEEAEKVAEDKPGSVEEPKKIAAPPASPSSASPQNVRNPPKPVRNR